MPSLLLYNYIYLLCVFISVVFAGKDYYKILSVSKSASAADIKVCIKRCNLIF